MADAATSPYLPEHIWNALTLEQKEQAVKDYLTLLRCSAAFVKKQLESLE
jgi:hypothetical protein